MAQRLLQKGSEADSDYLALLPLSVSVPSFQVSQPPIILLIPSANTLGQCKLAAYKAFVCLLVCFESTF